MDMEMGDAFPAVAAIINDETETRFGEALLLRHGLRDKDQVAEKRLIFDFGRGDARDFLFGNDQNVDRRLRLAVVEGQAEVVFVDDSGGNFAGADLGEYRTHENGNLGQN